MNQSSVGQGGRMHPIEDLPEEARAIMRECVRVARRANQLAEKLTGTSGKALELCLMMGVVAQKVDECAEAIRQTVGEE